jgi:hypothetical protein
MTTDMCEWRALGRELALNGDELHCTRPKAWRISNREWLGPPRTRWRLHRNDGLRKGGLHNTFT